MHHVRKDGRLNVSLSDRACERPGLVQFTNLRAWLGVDDADRFAELLPDDLDRSREIVGTMIAGHKVRPIEDLARGVATLKAEIGIVAVPADAAPAVASMLVDAHIRGILNFTPCRLDVPPAICVRNVDFSVALEQLAFDVSLAATQDDEP